jgi:2-methylisocitrate lyase-like PEP mutase family enzyme
MLAQDEKGRAFRALHERDRAFIIPNPWNVGTARLLAQLGFEALAGYAFSLGQRDKTIGRGAMMAHVSAIRTAGQSILRSQFDGLRDALSSVTEPILKIGADGKIGGRRDSKMYPGVRAGEVYELAHAVDRVRAPRKLCATSRFVSP